MHVFQRVGRLLLRRCGGRVGLERQDVGIGRHGRRRHQLQQRRQRQRVLEVGKAKGRQLGRVVALAVRVQMSRAGRIDHFRGAAAGRRRLGGRETARRHCSGGPTDAEPLEGAGRRQSLPRLLSSGAQPLSPLLPLPGASAVAPRFELSGFRGVVSVRLTPDAPSAGFRDSRSPLLLLLPLLAAATSIGRAPAELVENTAQEEKKSGTAALGTALSSFESERGRGDGSEGRGCQLVIKVAASGQGAEFPMTESLEHGSLHGPSRHLDRPPPVTLLARSRVDR